MKNKFHLLVTINIAALMVLMDLSAINIAMPTIKEHFNISVTTVSLVLMSSMLTATGTALIFGRFLEAYNQKRILMIAFLIFGFTTTITSQITSFYWLIPLRFVQGIAEAALYVSGPALIKQYIEPDQQQKQYGIWMMSCGLGISLGPILGGLTISFFGWEMVFLINLPLSLLGFYFASNLSTNKNRKEHVKFDTLGSIYSFLFLGTFILLFNLIANQSINPIIIWACVILNLLFLFLFIRHESSFSSPILDLKLFKIINFRQANYGFFLFFFVNVGSRFLRPFYFEESRLLSPSTSGLLMMVSPVVMLIISLCIHYLKRYFSTRTLVISGNILLSISMLMFSFWEQNSSLFFIIISMLILGLAMGIYYPTTTQIGMKSIPNGKHGMGSASISISKSIGKLMGVLIFGLLFQIFYDFLVVQNHSELMIKTEAIQLVFTGAFVISLINTILSFGIKETK